VWVESRVYSIFGMMAGGYWCGGEVKILAHGSRRWGSRGGYKGKREKKVFSLGGSEKEQKS